jgi:hypothetical protein
MEGNDEDIRSSACGGGGYVHGISAWPLGR